eukprot:TRINITY_DN4742_c0_g2_i2.p2 TRINITY_DN4742_c0_g2~~TRINITY_DN4742_c0_g2_i2.p2  ORF type:complete len:115 (+),score=15.26 TRINITY_DN4742_c0_g2_i2:168-512(+)
MNAEAYAKKMETIAMNTNWYESKSRSDKLSQVRLAEKRSQEELQFALDELKVSRSTRLKELYDQEAKLYQEELSQRGLAIRKERFQTENVLMFQVFVSCTHTNRLASKQNPYLA